MLMLNDNIDNIIQMKSILLNIRTQQNNYQIIIVK